MRKTAKLVVTTPQCPDANSGLRNFDVGVYQICIGSAKRLLKIDLLTLKSEITALRTQAESRV